MGPLLFTWGVLVRQSLKLTSKERKCGPDSAVDPVGRPTRVYAARTGFPAGAGGHATPVQRSQSAVFEAPASSPL